VTFRWANFTTRQRQLFQASAVFLEARAARTDTLLWALKLKPSEDVLKAALLTVVHDAIDDGLPEPWRSAWRLVEEAWQEPVMFRNSTSMAAVRVHQQVRQGDRSGPLIREIVDLVKPRLQVEPGRRLEDRSKRWKPKHLADLVRASLTSGELQSPEKLGLDQVNEPEFLRELARALDAAVNQGLETARRFGWDGTSVHALGSLDRVENVPGKSGRARDEVDEFHDGIAPSTKLLHAVVQRLANIAPDQAIPIIASFARAGTIIHERLWASFALDPRFVTGADVEAYLTSLSERKFWRLHSYPEVAELRARRFEELSSSGKAKILRRLRNAPPRSLWRAGVEKERIEDMRIYWKARELRRIQIGGGKLPTEDEEWLRAELVELKDLAESNKVDDGFPGTYEAFDIPPPGDDGYDLLSGRERLHRLEQALGTSAVGWRDDPADRADAWIGQPRNALKIIEDLEGLQAGERNFPEVWERFGWRHQPQSELSGISRDLEDEARRVLDLIEGLSDDTLKRAVDGLSDWLSDWAGRLKEHPSLTPVWHRIWPHAVAATDKEQPEDEAPSLNVIVQSQDDKEPEDLDTYNTAVGRMVGAFLNICPHLGELAGQPAFPPDAPRTSIRNAIIGVQGRAGLVAHHRLLEHLSYFMKADPSWVQARLLPSLTAGDDFALPLWNAVVRRTITTELLSRLAPFMLMRATDGRLPRETRRSLAFRLVVESLHAFRENREPWVTPGDLQRTLRELDEEVRASAAQAPQKFLRDVSAEGKHSREELFTSAVAPFLRRVWPQERSLTTPGVSKAFADIPATAGEQFVAAVDAIERFLVPFDCWSMMEYGLYGEDEDHSPRLAIVNTAPKAEAFLRLLDRTVGSAEGAVIPTDLSAALHHVRTLAPTLAETPIYRRLATSARL
jgi:hypothetical protein